MKKQFRLAASSAAIASALVCFPALAADDAFSFFGSKPTAQAEPAIGLADEAASLAQAGKLDEASKKINAALAMKPEHSGLHYLNGLIYHLQAQQGKQSAQDLAEQGYMQALRFDRGNDQASYMLGRLDIERGRYTQAVARLSEALMLEPDNRDMLLALSHAAYRAGMPDVAAAAAKRADAAAPLKTTTELKSASMALASAGSFADAQAYADKIPNKDAGLRKSLAKRIDGWKTFHEETLASAPKSSSAIEMPVAAQPLGAGAPACLPGKSCSVPGGAATIDGSAEKMVVVDIVMIATEETTTSSKGVNLLNGLQLQFGGASNAPAWSRTTTGTVDAVTGAETGSTALTRALTIPAIAYTLNIANSNWTRSEILARPTLVARAATTSEFFSGQEINAVAVASGTTGGSPVNINKNIGVDLKVTPTYVDEDRISLDILAERTFISPPSNNVNFTFKMATSKSNVKANVVMRFGETLILGGLSEKESDNARDGVPGLQDVPLVQYAFSQASKLDYQKSVLILVTPRPAQFVHQSEKARKAREAEMSEDEKPLANLRSRYADWFRPYPNWASVFHHLQENSLYREFRTGDVSLESWTSQSTLKDRLEKAVEFIHY